jgi:putative ABC transport system permease protein
MVHNAQYRPHPVLTKMRDLVVAIRNVVRQQRRSLVALIAIVAGVAALMFAGGFIDWILTELRERTIRSQLGHIQVRNAASATDNPTRLSRDSPVKDRIARTVHVKAIGPRLSLSGLISRNDITLAFLGEGVDPANDIAAGADNLVSGKPLDPTAERQILVGEGLAASLEVKSGDQVVLLVNLEGGGINATDVTIAGIFRTISKSFDDAAIRVPLRLAQNLLKTLGEDVWVVTLDRTESTLETVTTLRSDPMMASLEFTPWMDLADFYNKAVVLYAHQFAVMQALIAIIIMLSISNTMMMNVTERTWEVGTMMAMGTTRASVLRMFVLEAAVLGVIGGVIGVLLGLLINALVSAVGIPMPPAPGMSKGFLAEASSGMGLALSAFALGAVTTCAASIFPAFKASRLPIVDALRTSR